MSDTTDTDVKEVPHPSVDNDEKRVPHGKSTFHVFRENSHLILKLGSGFFADAYDLFVIDIVLAILQELQNEDPEGIGLTQETKGLIAAATSAGAVLGMIFFGVLGDYAGRRVSIICTGSLVVLGSIASACVQRSEVFSLAYQLCICRLVLGFGIGGEYPLSAAMASERASSEVRGRVVAGVFSMQGLGMIAASILPLIFLYAGASLPLTWRFLLGIAVLPSAVALYFRFGLKESSAFHQSRQRAPANFGSRIKSVATTIFAVSVPLLGTSLSWLFMDITFYGTGEFKHAVADSLFPSANVHSKVIDASIFAMIISFIALPGYICACLFIDRLGRWTLQVLGFCMMAVFYLVMAICIQFNANAYLNLVVFGVTFFWTNFGPNTTTFIIPSEIFPTQVKTTCHGFSAAMGKVGAIIGAYSFPTLQAKVGLFGVMYVCAVIAAVGLVSTLVFLKKSVVKNGVKL
ncbi:inorganic phosphate transporter, putative [Perkinsus marinus ATCC 50983]|uniref:Inorganic phosphate transporter, putative n=1 Tax=Perkinsus marinus (strain ATCC 50983 / TXsc) TaxID=423536 RepID=C5KPT9_PERM5|nr:inorganic phosphate transporter, putative [Perkinsus marinus ATCC 50983]EER13486.1 inorganic phosphate transporter, putative [Perkinsus marinus ATCC 50983]|eukprot:XP_002781691.1 inorganic phosphate transporter, putative [Perkinsus marinus ATCC 50983]